MNKKIITLVEKRILKRMMGTEYDLKRLLGAETHNVPEAQLDGLLVRIEQLLGKIVIDQNKLMLLQELNDNK